MFPKGVGIPFMALLTRFCGTAPVCGTAPGLDVAGVGLVASVFPVTPSCSQKLWAEPHCLSFQLSLPGCVVIGGVSGFMHLRLSSF